MRKRGKEAREYITKQIIVLVQMVLLGKKRKRRKKVGIAAKLQTRRVSAWTDRQINNFTQSFSALKQSLETGTSIQAAVVCFRLDENVNKLREMHPVFNSLTLLTTPYRVKIQALSKLGADMGDPARSECLPDTRMDILTEIFAWVSRKRWLDGPSTTDRTPKVHSCPSVLTRWIAFCVGFSR